MISVDEYLARTANQHLFDLGHAWLWDSIAAGSRAPCRRCGLDYLSDDGWSDTKCPGVRPTYRNAAFAVYPIDGQFHVTRYGGDNGEPFRTADADLAREICDHWATDPSLREG